MQINEIPAFLLKFLVLFLKLQVIFFWFFFIQFIELLLRFSHIFNEFSIVDIGDVKFDSFGISLKFIDKLIKLLICVNLKFKLLIVSVYQNKLFR